MTTISKAGTGLGGATQEPTVTEPQPSPGPVKAKDSPPHDQERTPRTGVVGDPIGTWPSKEAVDPHPLTPEDTRRAEKPAGLVAPSREYGAGFSKEAREKLQAKAMGREYDPNEPANVANIPTGAVPVETEDTTGNPTGEQNPPTPVPGTNPPTKNVTEKESDKPVEPLVKSSSTAKDSTS